MTNEGAVLRGIALRNGQKWGNIKRTIRDLSTIEDYESDKAAGESTAQVLSNFLNKKDDTSNKLVTMIEKLDARLDALEAK